MEHDKCTGCRVTCIDLNDRPSGSIRRSWWLASAL